MKKVYKKITGKKTKIDVCIEYGKELIGMNEAIKLQKILIKNKQAIGKNSKTTNSIFGILKNRKIKYSKKEHEKAAQDEFR